MSVAHEVVLFPIDLRKPGDRRQWDAGVYATFEHFLGEQGLHMTSQRKAVLRCLLEGKHHLREEEIYYLARKQESGLGRTTVFRTLKLLEQCGLADRVEAADGTPRFELKHDRPHHDHMVCVECGAILEFHNDRMEAIQNEAIREAGFTALWHRHEIFGRCRGCAGKRSPAK